MIQPTFFQTLFNVDMLKAAGTTIWIAVASEALGVLIGFVFVAFQMARLRLLRWIAVFYLWFFRGSPELLQIIAWYAVLPLFGIVLPIWMVALLGLGVNEGARMTEVIRGGLLSVDGGQTDAARILGLKPHQIFFRVTLPQAIVLIVPPLGNQINYMFKSTSLVSTIGVIELLGETQQLAQFTTSPLVLYLAGAVYYLAITTLWALAQHAIESRVAIGPRAPHGRRVLAARLAALTDLPGHQL
jgi:polar amino acid transport system permease protein